MDMIGGKKGAWAPPPKGPSKAKDMLSGADEMEEEPAEKSPGDEAMTSAAEDLCSALGVDPAKAGEVKAALRNFYRAC